MASVKNTICINLIFFVENGRKFVFFKKILSKNGYIVAKFVYKYLTIGGGVRYIIVINIIY